MDWEVQKGGNLSFLGDLQLQSRLVVPVILHSRPVDFLLLTALNIDLSTRHTVNSLNNNIKREEDTEPGET
jgi:hypothetical protein